MRGVGLLKHDNRRRHAIQPSFPRLDDLSQASKDMQDMRDCYDSLLSTAAGTMNTAYEFSESLQEMGDCLLEKTALSDDEDAGRVFLMLGKVQFHIQKLIDDYRSHIYQTITAPSESLLNELHIVEDMKKQCDEKSSTYEALKVQYDNERLKNSEEEDVSSHQLQSARDEFDEDATLFIFRVKSLKRGQSRSLLTQAARHYAAQMAFFRKALKSLEEIEPHVKSTTEQQHIDYCFSGLEDDDRDSVFLTDNEDDENEENSDKLNIDSHMKGIYLKTGSKSAPLSVEGSFDHYEKYRQSSTRKLNTTYVLPTPVEKSSVTSGNESQHSRQPRPSSNMWHSMPMPLEPNKYEKKPMLSASGPIPTLTPLLSTSELSSLRVGGLLLPKIREPHKLPRPPGTSKPSKLSFSAPLVTFKHGPDFDTNKLSVSVSVSDAAYTLPIPQDFKDTISALKQTETVNLRTYKGMISPPLSPISFKNILQGSTAT